ncbi:aspartyl aminopeptidase [Kockovaella imperatae]|uniref:aspartyl aminopeptidase n=1 Tax=Kockovaella imperatae TaxID=4999 RepID=A0A1Y1UQ41_9TREE|nr:aspartyl aminopeptidase [Kockovaella imperatae]ORX40092.1 aspartyl aminopeptidase [Kockovaella imperatae]
MKLLPTPPADATKFCNFITGSPTPFQAVANLSARLVESGFKPISERLLNSAELANGGKYFYTRNQSSLVAFTLPKNPSPTTAISIVAGHTDSPCLKIRPVSKRETHGYLQIGVETYGGGTWPTWFDRDLGLAGRVIVAQDDGKFVSKLINLHRPLMRIPNLAPHLDRTLIDEMKINKETNIRPIAGLAAEILNEKKDKAETSNGEKKSGMQERHDPMLLKMIAEELDCGVEHIQDFELSLYDVQPAQVGGMSNEFIFAARMDNLMTSYSAIEALCEHATTSKTDDDNVHAVIVFDNEEIGSISNHGAESNILPSFVERIVAMPEFAEIGYQRMLAHSFLISADMGHALHPNYSDKYELNNSPKMNAGPVIKTNANGRYTSTAQTTFLLRQVAKKVGVPLQDYEVRNDSSCGSTIGPHLSTYLRTVDIGLATLAMHSIRETAGSADVRMYIDLFKGFFDHFAEIDKALKVD